jgi:hypothetical protein
MISQESQKLIKKKWPGIEDNKILLEFARQELFNYTYPFEHLTAMGYSYPYDSPEEAKVNFCKRAKFKAWLTLFAAILVVICAVLYTVNQIRWFGFAYWYLYIESIVWLAVACVFYRLYRNKRKLIKCYDELIREVGETNGELRKFGL